MTNKLLILLTERTKTKGSIGGEICVVSNFDAVQLQNHRVHGKTVKFRNVLKIWYKLGIYYQRASSQ